MTQTASAISGKDCFISFGTNTASLTDISGFTGSVEVSGGERDTAGTKTFDGDTAILTAGKRNPITVTARAVYTETASEPYKLAVSCYENGTACYIRWSPKGDDAAELRYTTSAGYIKNPVYPSASADSADAMMIEIVLECASITEATV